MFARILVLLITACALLSCRPAAEPGRIRLQLDRKQTVSLGLFDLQGRLLAQPLVSAPLEKGTHSIDCRDFVPGGEYRWKAVLSESHRLEPIASIGAGVGANAQATIFGGDAGPPCAVAAEGERVFLGWRMAHRGHEVVACGADGTVLWGYHRGPGPTGIWDLAADGDTVYVLASSEGANGDVLLKLDAASGKPRSWGNPGPLELPIRSLWGKGKSKPDRAEYLAADNGRLYLTFAKEEFVAVLNADTGAYAITLSGPDPGRMALSTTPMKDPSKPGGTKVIDFGIAALARNGLAYFLMEHEPPWVMLSTTRWMKPGTRIRALAPKGDTMRSSDLSLYTALGEPDHQIQLLPIDSVEGYLATVGTLGGRPLAGAWQPEGLRDVRALAIDARGRLWVAECDESFGRFTVWNTEGPVGRLEREILGPFSPGSFSADPADPCRVRFGGLEWQVDRAGRRAACTQIAPANLTPGFQGSETLKDSDGLVLWKSNLPGLWSVHPMPAGPPIVWLRAQGAHAFALLGPENARIQEGTLAAWR